MAHASVNPLANVAISAGNDAYSRRGPLASSRAIVAIGRLRLPPQEALFVTTSLTDAVLLKVMSLLEVKFRAVFIDTGYHFPETMDYLEAVEATVGMPIEMLSAQETRADHEATMGEQPYRIDPEMCCFKRKVEPLNAALESERTWVTGLRRADGPSRAAALPLDWDVARGVLKINPLVLWSDADVDEFVETYQLPSHPLRAKGFLSIGCEPCTAPSTEGDLRSGRWSWSTKTECGLHREFS